MPHGSGHAGSLPLASADVLPLVYDELRALARRHLARERPGHTLQATALVHEAYLRLSRQRNDRWNDRGHFFAVAASMIRRILVNHARARSTLKRGRGRRRIALEDGALVADAPSIDLLALDDALCALERLDQRQSRIVELRFFGGLGVEDVARILAVSPRTVEAEWTLARAWLRTEMDGGAPGEGPP